MRKIYNTFKYGSGYTKRVLIFSILSGIITVGLVAFAIILGKMLLFFGALIGLFTTLSLIQTFQIGESGETSDNEKADEISDVVSDESSGKVKKVKNSKIKASGDKRKKDKRENNKEEINKENNKENNKEEKVKENKIKKNQKDKEEKENQEQVTQDEAVEPEQASASDIDSYDRSTIKKTLKKFKVKRDHRMVMIDFCEKLKINQSPAYVWVHDGQFHILVIEKEPRHITVPLVRIQSIKYLKKQPGNPDLDYAAFQGNSVMAEMFKPYLPDYVHSTVVDDLTAYKNLYGIGPDIYFTNRSASNLFDLLGVQFEVEDKVTTSKKVNVYFKDTYMSNILLRDNVIDANGYADRISNILDEMAHSTISYAGFKDTLNLMIKNKLITQEFAMYYMEVRDKISG